MACGRSRGAASCRGRPRRPRMNVLGAGDPQGPVRPRHVRPRRSPAEARRHRRTPRRRSARDGAARRSLPRPAPSEWPMSAGRRSWSASMKPATSSARFAQAHGARVPVVAVPRQIDRVDDVVAAEEGATCCHTHRRFQEAGEQHRSGCRACPTARSARTPRPRGRTRRRAARATPAAGSRGSAGSTPPSPRGRRRPATSRVCAATVGRGAARRRRGQACVRALPCRPAGSTAARGLEAEVQLRDRLEELGALPVREHLRASS